MDDISEPGDDNDLTHGDGRFELSSAVYDKAVHFINWYVVGVSPYYRSSDIILIPFGFLAFCLILLTTSPLIWRFCERSALIIELGSFNPPNGTDSTSDSGRSTPSFDLSEIPQSMRTAESFIRSHVFLNVRDYLALRSQGQEALQNALNPSKKSLVTELRKKDARVPRDWVKQRGLDVPLATCF